jgi:hypothetical protein
MKKSKPQLTYTFINPNSDKEVENILKQILVEKLLSLYTYADAS